MGRSMRRYVQAEQPGAPPAEGLPVILACGEDTKTGFRQAAPQALEGRRIGLRSGQEGGQKVQPRVVPDQKRAFAAFRQFLQ